MSDRRGAQEISFSKHTSVAPTTRLMYRH